MPSDLLIDTRSKGVGRSDIVLVQNNTLDPIQEELQTLSANSCSPFY